MIIFHSAPGACGLIYIFTLPSTILIYAPGGFFVRVEGQRVQPHCVVSSEERGVRYPLLRTYGDVSGSIWLKEETRGEPN